MDIIIYQNKRHRSFVRWLVCTTVQLLNRLQSSPLLIWLNIKFLYSKQNIIYFPEELGKLILLMRSSCSQFCILHYLELMGRTKIWQTIAFHEVKYLIPRSSLLETKRSLRVILLLYTWSGDPAEDWITTKCILSLFKYNNGNHVVFYFKKFLAIDLTCNHNLKEKMHLKRVVALERRK